MRTYKIVRQNSFAPVLFWLVQFFLGMPSIFQAGQLLLSGKAEGALFMIALFLAWIGATIAVGVAALIHGRTDIELDAASAANISNEPLPEGYQDRYNGFPFKLLAGGGVEALTGDGPRTYTSWAAFKKAIGAN